MEASRLDALGQRLVPGGQAVQSFVNWIHIFLEKDNCCRLWPTLHDAQVWEVYADCFRRAALTDTRRRWLRLWQDSRRR